MVTRAVHAAVIEAARHGDKPAVIQGLQFLIDAFRGTSHEDVVDRYVEILEHVMEDGTSFIEIREQMEELFKKLDERFAATLLVIQLSKPAPVPAEPLQPQSHSLN